MTPDQVTTNTIRVGMLRQWLNENRQCTPLVTNADILFWLTGDKEHLVTPDQAIAQERARLREEVVKLMKKDGDAGLTGVGAEGYNTALADVLALLRE
jgi:hypothetical protein